jgi:hypothetical protein
MTGHNKFYGVYRGVVVDNKDPLKKGRLRLRIPQVLGNTVTEWAWAVHQQDVATKPIPLKTPVWAMFEGGDPSFPMWIGLATEQGSVQTQAAPQYYGSFYNTTTVSLTSATTAYPLPLDSTAEAVGVSIASGSRITVAHAGVYNIQFSAQLDKTNSNNDLVNIWFAKNGTNVAQSNTQVTVLGNNGKYLASWNFVLTLAANDYVQIMAQSPDTHMRIVASGTQTNPARPAVPSIIVTVTEVR